MAVDPERLALLGHAVEGPVDVQALAKSLRIPPRRLLAAAARLREAGLLDEQFRLNRTALREVAAALPKPEAVAASVVAGPWSVEETEVLARFFHGTRLKEIPIQRSKRMVVLERLAQEFEPGLRYPERQVNYMLQLFHPDYAALRRYLVDEGFLTRAEGVYWRSGGRVDH